MLQGLSEMDVRLFNQNGETICPQCNRAYRPELGERQQPNIPIQQEFPHSKSYQREQLITGLCSDECWNTYLGVGDDEEE